MNTDNKENIKFRYLSAIAIFMIVNGHFGTHILTVDQLFPYYSFHVVLFVFISGYFFKENKCLKLNEFIGKKFKKLICPLYMYTTIFSLLYLILKAWGVEWGFHFTIKQLIFEPILSTQALPFTYPMWFVSPLFFCEVFMAVMYKFIPGGKLKDALIYIITAILNIAVYFLSKGNLDSRVIQVLLKSLFFTFFFQSGYIYKKYMEDNVKINSCIFLIILIFVKIILIFINGGNGIYVISNLDFTGCRYFFIPILISLCGILFWLTIADMLSSYEDKLMISIGRNTYTIMAMHIFIGRCIMLLMIIVRKLTNGALFSGMSIDSFKTDMKYFFYPVCNASVLLFIIVSIAASLFFSRFLEFIKNRIKFFNS